MDLEVKNYIDRLNEELPRLLRWRKEILDQIEIDRKLPAWQTTERYHQIVSSLNQSIDKLKEENRVLKNKREDAEEISVFAKRLAGELEQLLERKNEVKAETESEEKRLNKISNERLEILLDLNKQLITSRLSLEEIKSAKKDFLSSLEDRRKRLELKDEELANKEKTLIKKTNELDARENKISRESEELLDEKSVVALSRKSIDRDRKNIEKEIVKIKSERIAGQELNRIKEEKLKKLDDSLKEINKKGQALLFKEEALSKQEEMILVQIDKLNKDKNNLINQQSSLRRAIFLARLKGVNI